MSLPFSHTRHALCSHTRHLPSALTLVIISALTLMNVFTHMHLYLATHFRAHSPCLGLSHVIGALTSPTQRDVEEKGGVRGRESKGKERGKERGTESEKQKEGGGKQGWQRQRVDEERMVKELETEKEKESTAQADNSVQEGGRRGRSKATSEHTDR